MIPSLHRYYRLFPPPTTVADFGLCSERPPDRPCTCHFTRFYGFVRIIVEEMRQKLQRKGGKKSIIEKGKKRVCLFGHTLLFVFLAYGKAVRGITSCRPYPVDQPA